MATVNASPTVPADPADVFQPDDNLEEMAAALLAAPPSGVVSATESQDPDIAKIGEMIEAGVASASSGAIPVVRKSSVEAVQPYSAIEMKVAGALVRQQLKDNNVPLEEMTPSHIARLAAVILPIVRQARMALGAFF